MSLSFFYLICLHGAIHGGNCVFFIFIWSYLCNIKERIICEPPLPTPTCTYEEVI